MAVGITPVLNWARVNARIDTSYVREVLGEFVATFILCLFAVGGTCNLNAAGPPNLPGFRYSPTDSVFPVAFGYFLATLLFGGVSGAHVNPAISIGMAIAGRLSWIKLHAFILVQLLGGYLGSLMAYAMFKSHFNIVSRTLNVTLQNISDSAAIFNASPGNISLGSGFFNEIVLTALFMMAFLAVKDMWNSRCPRYVQGVLIGLVVIGLGLAFGQTTGVAINPVRDLCPRIAALTLGWKSDSVMKGVMRGGQKEQWWTVGFFAPFIGAIIGATIYIFIIGAQLRYDDEEAGDLVTGEGGYGMDPQGHERWKGNGFVPRLGSPARQQQPQNQQPQQFQQQPMSPYARVQFRHQ